MPFLIADADAFIFTIRRFSLSLPLLFTFLICRHAVDKMPLLPFSL